MMYNERKIILAKGITSYRPRREISRKVCLYHGIFGEVAVTAVVDPPTGVEPAPTAAQTAPGAPTAV